MKDNIFNRIFHSRELYEQVRKEESERFKQKITPLLLEKLESCEVMNDLLLLHKRIYSMEMGYDVDIKLQDQENNYTNVPVSEATVEHFYCATYDRDGTYHGKEMIEYEKCPTRNEYDYNNYGRAWCCYYNALYLAITGIPNKTSVLPSWYRKL